MLHLAYRLKENRIITFCEKSLQNQLNNKLEKLEGKPDEKLLNEIYQTWSTAEVCLNNN